MYKFVNENNDCEPKDYMRRKAKKLSSNLTITIIFNISCVEQSF